MQETPEQVPQDSGKGSGGDISGYLEGATKLFLSAAGFVYVAGFFVVAIHLSRYEIAPFGAIRAQYVLAGLWAAVPAILIVWVVVVIASHVGGSEAAPDPARGIRRYLKIVVRAVTGIFLAFGAAMILIAILAWTMPAEVSDVRRIAPLAILKLTVIFALLCGCAIATWVFLRDVYRGGRLSVPDALWSSNYMGVTLALFFGYLASFAAAVYPNIPHELGGGTPVPLRLVLKQGETTTEVLRHLGVPEVPTDVVFNLILQTDRAYFIESPREAGASVEIPKDSVALAIFGP
jgi:hypothetical protein